MGGFLGSIFGKKTTDPNTGEQHRSGLRGMVHGLHGLERGIRPIAKTALPIVGSLAGGMFGGPMGSMAGGALGGALSSKRHPLDHALGGAGVGLGNAFLGPKIGKMFGVNPEGTMGNLMMMNHPTMMDQMGSILGPAAFAGKGLGYGAKSPPSAAQSGMLQQLGLSGKDLLDTALFGTSIAGIAGGRSKASSQPSLDEVMKANRPKWGPEDQPRPKKNATRKYIQPAPDYMPGKHGEHLYFEEQPYARGGHVKGGEYIKGIGGGQQDNVPKNIPEGSFVMDATTVSLLGDGNSENGKKRLEQIASKYARGGTTSDSTSRHARHIPAKVSSGEFIFLPHVVSNMGNGSNARGSALLNKMRINIRKQKGVQKFLPPKSKHFEHYTR